METKSPNATTSSDGSRDPDRREVLSGLASLTLASLVTAVLPRVRAVYAGAPPSVSIDTWRQWTRAARDALALGVDEWSQDAVVAGGVVNGSTVFLPPGSLSGPPFEPLVAAAMQDAGAPPEVAAAFAGVAWEAWRTWAASYHLTVAKALKAFAAVPAPEAPETPIKKRKLKSGAAPGSIGMTVEVLGEALAQVLQPVVADDPNAQTAIVEFADAYASGFGRWFRRATLVNLLGKGPVPSYSPPYVPVGPTVAGEVFGVSVIEAPAFVA